jgi:hypothetical protein
LSAEEPVGQAPISGEKSGRQVQNGTHSATASCFNSATPSFRQSLHRLEPPAYCMIACVRQFTQDDAHIFFNEQLTRN